MKKSLFLGALLFTVISLFLNPAGVYAQKELLVTVSHKAEGLAEDIIEEFEKDNPEIHVEMDRADSETVIMNLISKKAEVGLITKELSGADNALGVIGTLLTAGTGETGPIYITTYGEPEGLAKEFVDFCLGSEVEDIIINHLTGGHKHEAHEVEGREHEGHKH